MNEYKSQGNQAFMNQDYLSAISFYTQAITLQPHETVYCNRAASYLAIRDF